MLSSSISQYVLGDFLVEVRRVLSHNGPVKNGKRMHNLLVISTSIYSISTRPCGDHFHLECQCFVAFTGYICSVIILPTCDIYLCTFIQVNVKKIYMSDFKVLSSSARSCIFSVIRDTCIRHRRSNKVHAICSCTV